MNSQSDFLSSPLYKYLSQSHPQPPLPSTLPSFHTHLLTLITSQTQQLTTLSSDLTKSRCQVLKLTKQLKQLQDKTSNNTNTNNTGSSFMMPSEFKAQFENFMKQTVPSVLGAVTHRPKAMVGFLQEVMEVGYGGMEGRLEAVVGQVMAVLGVKEGAEGAGGRRVVFAQLLKILQDNHEELLAVSKEDFISCIAKPYRNDPDFKQILQSQDFQQLLTQLNRLIAYMLLQQNKWQFLIPKNKMMQFTKKQCTCVDGWVKQKEMVLVVVQGLKREATQGQPAVHPNLRNFVVPVVDGEEEVPVVESGEKGLGLIQPPKLTKRFSVKSEDKPGLGLVTILSLQLQPTKPIKHIPAIQTVRSQQIPPKQKPITQPPNDCASLQRRLRAYTDDALIKPKPPTPTTTNTSTTTSLQPQKKKKLGTGKIAGLLTDPNFSQILAFPKQRTKREQLTSRPSLDEQLESRIVNRQLQIRKQQKRQDRIKKQKSIGKIVNQFSKLSLRDQRNESSTTSTSHIRCSSNKENQSSNVAKEAAYKEIIRNKFKEERSVLKIRDNDKKQAIAFGDPFVAKTERVNKEVEGAGRREENRPLKPSQEHMKRFREKHHLLF